MTSIAIGLTIVVIFLSGYALGMLTMMKLRPKYNDY